MPPSESSFTQRLTKELRRQLPDAIIVKLNDQATGGLPDFFVSHKGTVNWFEVKLTSNKKMFVPLQWEMLRRLQNGMYIVWDGRHGCIVWVYGPYKTQDIRRTAGMNFSELIEAIIKICND